MYRKVILGCALCFSALPSYSEVNISGFTSINAGKVLSGSGVPHYGINEPTRKVWKDMLGGVLHGSNDWLELRATIMTNTNQRYRSGEPALWDGKNKRDGTFYGFAANADFGNLFVWSELNRLDLDGNLDTAMLTLGYRFNSLTPFISYSAFKQKGG